MLILRGIVMKFFYQDYANKPGIYKIINTHTNRIYIGQTWSFKDRWRDHKKYLLNGSHQNKFILNDFNKCKIELNHDDFLEFHVLEVMESSSKEERNKREEEIIAEYWDRQELCYNFKKKTEAKRRGVYSNTPEETSKLISANMKEIWADPEHREKRLTKIRSEEVRNKISNSVKELWENGEYKETAQKIAEIVRSPEYISKAKERCNDPAYKEIQAQKLKDVWSRDDGTRRKTASEIGKRVRAERAKELTEAVVASKAKHYGKVQSPNGIVYDVYNLEKFARDNGIDVSSLRLIMKGKTLNSRSGWKRVVQ